ncbi:hypothetical protein HWV62_1629 [Athelia sp. TMB]|nr:hypothetical protein HWV62_1629 [Athelia sp. TMB]
MANSSKSPRTPASHKRHHDEVDSSNVIPEQTKKQRRPSKKQQELDQAQQVENIKQMEKALKKMRKDLKMAEAGKTPVQAPDEDPIEAFESEEEDPEPISSFRPEIRHIDTTISPSRHLIPAGSAPRPALTSVTNTVNHGRGDGDGDGDGVDFGIPTTATTSPPSPLSYHFSRSTTPLASGPYSFNIRGQSVANHPANEPLQVARWKNGIAPTSGNKPCASDYTDDVKRIILKACGRYEVFIITENAFPDSDTQLTKAQEYFAEACSTIGVKYQATDRIIGIIKARGSRIRGVLRYCTRLRADLTYRFKAGSTSKTIKQNKKNAQELLEGDCFCWASPLGRTGGFAECKLIYDILNNVFFPKFQKCLGMAYADHFNPIPLPTLALIITSIAFHIRQYEQDGVVGKQPFSENFVKDLYDDYLKKVQDWVDLDPIITLKLRERAYRHAVRFGGGSVTVVKGMSEDAKRRAQMELAGRDVDAARSDDSDASEEI